MAISLTSDLSLSVLKFEFSPIDNTSYRYTVSIRGLSYVVQSRTDLKFYNIKNVKVTDSTTRAKQDQIIFNTLNYKPGVTETFV